MGKNKDIQISPDVHVPREIATRRTAVFGISGSGKSNTAVVVIEGLLAAGEQVVLIDPKGEGWGLQTSADGKSAGFDVIVFGQPRGDVPELREEHAEQIADFVVDSGRSVVLSLLGFESDQAERRFVTRFFQRLYRRKSQQATKTRTLVVIEEAHLFVPEQASGGNAEMVGAIKRIARQGRSAGLGLMIVDQRPQDVAKSIISQCELLVCHQLVHKLDREALRDWVKAYDKKGEGDTFLASLADQKPGKGWVWSPAWLHLFVQTQFNRRSTYDSGATPDGSTAAAPKARATVNLDVLRTQMAKIVDEAKANDPKTLKAALVERDRAIATLTKERDAAANAKPQAAQKTRVVEKKVITDAQLARLEKLDEAGRKFMSDELARLEVLHTDFSMRTEAFWEKVIDHRTLMRTIFSNARAVAAMPAVDVNSVLSVNSDAGKSAALVRRDDVPGVVVGGGEPVEGITGRQQKMLNAAATLKLLGVEVSRETVSAWIGVHPRGGSVGEDLAALAKLGLITIDRGAIAVLDAGLKAAERLDPAKAIERAVAGLSGRQKKIINLVLAAHPGTTTREAVAAAMNIHPRGGSLGEDIARLVGRGLITSDRGVLRARDFLFAGGGKVQVPE